MKIAVFVLIVTAALNVTSAFAYDAEGSGKVSNGNCTCKKIVTGSPKQANSRGRNWPRPLSLWAVASERFLISESGTEQTVKFGEFTVMIVIDHVVGHETPIR